MNDVVGETHESDFTLNSRPYAPPEVFSKELGSGTWVLIDPEAPNWIAVDVIGKDIVDLCDGERRLREITETLCAKYDSDLDSSKDSIVEFANVLAKQGFVSSEPFSYSSVDKNTIRGMQTLWINITHRCNLRCLHCFREAGESQENELTTREILDVIDAFVELGGLSLIVSGGEPFLRSDILAILQHAKKRVRKVTILTNGTLIDAKAARFLKELEPVSVQVSIDGAVKKTNDRIRGNGSFEKALRGIRLLKEVSFTNDLIMAMTITKLNLREVKSFVDLAEELGATGVHFPLFQAVGRGRRHQKLLNPEPRDFREIFRQILAMRRTSSYNVEVPNMTDRVKYTRGAKRDLCGAGIVSWSIEPDGRVTPCAGLTDSQFVAGNIREQELSEIIHHSLVTERFRSMHVKDNPYCVSCELRFICGGGCYVERYTMHGELGASWPRCETAKYLYNELIGDLVRNREIRKRR